MVTMKTMTDKATAYSPLYEVGHPPLGPGEWDMSEDHEYLVTLSSNFTMQTWRDKTEKFIVEMTSDPAQDVVHD